MAKPNADEVQAKKDPESLSTVRSVAGIVFAFAPPGQSFRGYYKTYIDSLLEKLCERYFMNKGDFCAVAKGRQPRREVAGIRVEMVLPKGLVPAENVAYAKMELISSCAIGHLEHATGRRDPELSTAAEPPDIHLTQGGLAAEFTSLEAALDFLEAHPDKTVWVLAFDAPSFPKEEQINETGALLILALPDYPTGREPLAWIHRAGRMPLGKGRTATGWRAALGDAASRGHLAPDAIGYLVHDAGQGDAASKRLGDLSRGVAETPSGFDIHPQGFNSSAVLREMAAGTVPTNLLLGIAHEHDKHTPVNVAGTRETVAGEVVPQTRRSAPCSSARRPIRCHLTQSTPGFAPAATVMPACRGGAADLTPKPTACRAGRTKPWLWNSGTPG